MPIDLWAIANEELQKIQPEKQRNAFVLGPRSAGKTTLLRALTGETGAGEYVKPTALVDFCYFKSLSRKAEIINCYDFQGTPAAKTILPNFLNKDNFQSSILVIVVDLSKPQSIKSQLTKWLDLARQAVASAFQGGTSLTQRDFNNLYLNGLRRFERCPDKNQIAPLPFPALIVGSKYDLFRAFDPQLKKWVLRILRYMALSNGCSLSCFSRDATLAAQAKSFISAVMANEGVKRIEIDYQKPFYIAEAQDTIESMGLPRPEGKTPIQDTLQNEIQSRCSSKQELGKEEQRIDWGKYKEAKLDETLAQKESGK